MKKLVTSIILALAICSMAVFCGCGILGNATSGPNTTTGLNMPGNTHSVTGRYVFESLGGLTPAELSSQTGTALDENYMTFTFQDGGKVKCEMDYIDGFGDREQGWVNGTYLVTDDGIRIQFNNTLLNGTARAIHIQENIRGTVENGKIVLNSSDGKMVFRKA